MTNERTATSGDRTALFPTTGRAPFLALGAVVVSGVLTALAVFWDLTGNDPEPEEQPLGEFLVVLGVIIVVTAAVFLFVVRGAARGNPGRRSLILGILGVLSLAVFWAGVPVVLAAAAVAVALVERDALGRFGTMAKTGLGLAAAATLASIILAVAG